MRCSVMNVDWRKIERENQGLAVRSARFLGEGWNSHAYLVNEELVFRFPKRPGHWEELEREIAFLAFAADKLPLATPRYAKVARDSPAAAWGYAAYRYLLGQAMNVNVLSPEKRDAAADSVASFLRALHGLQPSPEVASILPREDERLVAERYYARAERTVAPELPASEAKALRNLFQAHLGAPENFSFLPVVLHADLSRDHVLIHDSSVSGVIDFGDVNWGDPDYDFMYLFVNFGPAFGEKVARRYGHPQLEHLRTKLQYYRLVDLIDTILHGEGLALEGQQEAAWRRLRQLLQDRK